MDVKEKSYKYKYICIRKKILCYLLKDFKMVNIYMYNDKKIKEYNNLKNKLLIEEYKNGLIIVKSVDALTSKSFIDVSENVLYDSKNINNLLVTNFVIEGTDGVGKTSTIIELVNKGIVCFDRDEEICKYMLFDIDEDTRCRAYKKYLDSVPYKIIFLINDSKEELDRRINIREKISEFDKYAYEYNLLYKNTYIAMQKYDIYDKLVMIDCTGLSFYEQVDKVKKYILENISGNI